ncbi:c-type cytochrome [Candidatus Poriferisodalis sp.]|uniref:c-type cytochrome n=1 Tax=Candidatus Poriferisodalis sp. TaxID=3101277 RepID=UPI003AF86F21
MKAQRSHAFAVAVLAASLVASGCGSRDATSEAAIGTQADSTASADAPVDGAATYQQYCAECHGVDLRGTDKGPSQLSIIYEPGHHSDYAFRSAISEGAPEHHWWFGDMPPVEGISDDEIEAVISFVRAEQERLGFEE